MSNLLQANAPGPAGQDAADDHHVLPIAAGGQVIAIPAEWKVGMCRWRSNGSAVYIRFGTSLSVTVPDETATSAIDGTTKVLTVGTNAPHEKVNASEVSQFFIPSWATHLNYKSTGTSLVGPWTVKGE